MQGGHESNASLQYCQQWQDDFRYTIQLHSSIQLALAILACLSQKALKRLVRLQKHASKNEEDHSMFGKGLFVHYFLIAIAPAALSILRTFLQMPEDNRDGLRQFYLLLGPEAIFNFWFKILAIEAF